MNTALWAASWGYFLEQMMAGSFGDRDTGIREARRHFIDHVRADGPLPALRVGRQPYGILPVTPLAAWQPLEGSTLDVGIVDMLRRLRGIWGASLSGTPALARGAQSTDLVHALAMDAGTRTLAARGVLGPGYTEYLWRFVGPRLDDTWWQRQNALADQVLTNLGVAWRPRLARSVFAPQPFTIGAPLVRLPGAGDGSTPPYLAQTLRALGHEHLCAASAIAQPSPLLYLLLRHAALLEYVGVAKRMLLRRGLITPADTHETELVDMYVEDDGTTTTTLWRSLARTLDVTGTQRLGDYLDALKNANRFTVPDVSPAVADDILEFGEFWRSVDALALRPAAALERALGGTLDVAAYRLDAWITSYASKRLAWLRSQAGRGSGLLLGGYGWLENVRPGSGTQAEFILAPSTTHAAAAAILRSGYLAHRADGPAHSFAVDISSARVRLALSLLDGVREGQPLGALLGYRFERSLHERMLGDYIAAFRRLAPSTTAGQSPGLPALQTGVASSVVDGMALQQRWKAAVATIPPTWSAATIPFGDASAGLPAAGSSDGVELQQGLRLLDDAVDAAADLLTFEGVYQLVRGNPERSGATLDAIGRGAAPPPELEAIRTPRSGIAVTHRIALLLESTAAPPSGDRYVRARAEPRLDRWAAWLLPDFAAVRCHAEYRDAATGELLTDGQRDVLLSELDLSALDVVVLSSGTQDGAPGELDARFRELLARTWPPADPASARLDLSYGRQPRWGTEIVSLDDLLEAARALRSLVSRARPLEARDVLPAAVEAPPAAPDVVELRARADDAQAALKAVGESLGALVNAPATADLVALRDALSIAASFGITGAIPAPTTGDVARDRAALVAQAQRGLVESGRRWSAARDADAAFDRSAPAEAQRDHDVRRLRLLFGSDFPVVPRFTPPNAADLRSALAASTTAQGNDALAATTWFQRVSRLREPASRLDLVLTYGQALTGTLQRPFEVIQLPYVPGSRWVGLDQPGDFPAGRLSLVCQAQVPFDPGMPPAGPRIAGLLVDEWTETVPGRSETAAVAFRYDAPDARAPQAILLAVPAGSQPWDDALVAGTVGEALDLAHLRAIDPDALGQVGQFLPALYLAINITGNASTTDPNAYEVGRDTVATDFTAVAGTPPA
jgi:hypothetical protein